MHNFTLRFVYEAFFELILCAMISLSKRQTYTGDNFQTQAERDAKFAGVGDFYEEFNTYVAGLVFVLCILLVLYSFGFGWQSLANSCCSSVKRKSIAVSNLYLEIASWILSFCQRYRLRQDYLKKVNAEIEKNEALDFIRQGAEPEKKKAGEIDDFNDLMIMTPWVKGVDQPVSVLIPMKHKPFQIQNGNRIDTEEDYKTSPMRIISEEAFETDEKPQEQLHANEVKRNLNQILRVPQLTLTPV